MSSAPVLPGGSRLTEEQESLLAMFLEKEGVETVEAVERKPIIISRPEDRYKPFPLTDIQLAYVIGRENASLGMSDVSSHVYFELETRHLDVPRYQEAWRKLIARHDMMRCVILPSGQQQVLEHVPAYEIAYFDLRGLGEEEKRERIEGIRDELGQAVKPADVWPMFDVYVTRLDEETYRIHLSLEGIFGDVLSLTTMLGETRRFYENPDFTPEPLDLTFRDYVLSLENRRNMDSYAKAREYWRERLPALAPAPAMPVLAEQDVRIHPKVRRFAGGLDREDWSRLKDMGTERGLSPTGILVAAFAEALRLWNREADFCLNLTLFNRLPLHPRIGDVIGDFTDTLLLESRAAPGKTFGERAEALRDRLWADLDNRQFSGMDVLRELNRYRSEKEQQYMPVVFTSAFLMGDYSNALTTMTLDGNPVEVVFSASQTPQLLIDHQVFEDRGRLGIHWDVRSEYFQPGYLEALFGAYTGLLQRLARDPAVWSEKEPVALPPDQRAARERFNDTAAPLPQGLLHTPFLEKARETPDAPAVIAPDRHLSYAETARRAAAVARGLRGNIRPEEPVAVIMRKGWEQIVAVLGILCAGGVYLPADPSLPAGRLALILRDGGVRTVLTQKALLDSVQWPEGVTPVAVDTLGEEDARLLYDSVPATHPESLAYVIYTSGSTGTPKGVMIEHGAALNTIAAVNERFGVGPHDRTLALASLSFDLSVWDIFGTLAAGGAIVVPDAGREKEPAHWLDLVDQEGVTVWNTVPAMMRMLVEYRAALGKNADKGSLRLVLLSGDWLPLSLPDQIRDHFPANVISLGGATEASIWSIFHPVEQVDAAWKSIPYGTPLPNQRFHVLNQFMQDCPDWVPGQLYIGGAGLARGYWNDPEKTAAAFITHPVSGERLYRTGDMGYFHPSGVIVLLGREDTQCKVNGFRVELGEVEHALRCHEAVRDAVVLPAQPAQGEGTHLRAFVTPRQHHDASLYRVLENDGAPALWDGVLALDGGARQQDTASVERTFERLTALYDDALQALVFELGLFVREGDAATAEECVRKGRINPRYGRWMRRALDVLAQQGFLAREGETYRCIRPMRVTSFAEVEKTHQKTTGFMLMSAVRLADILREKLHSAELYAMPEAKGVYPSMFKSSNEMIRKCMALFAARDKPLRILEVGGGHGGTTGSLLDAFDPAKTEYCFTDISPYFLNNASENFKDYPFLTYQLYNLDNPPAPQGLEPHSFDAIIASSVLHDTRKIDETLGNLLSLLRPGGMLFLVEQTEFLRWYDIGMGLQQGFDVFEDTDLRKDNPLIAAGIWEDRLRAAGFVNTHVFGKLDAKFALGMDLIVAQGPGSVRLFDAAVLEDFLRDRLPSYMIPAEYILLQRLPRNRSGKTDRKALEALGGGHGVRKIRHAPRTETEKRLAALWASVLAVDSIGLKDNFFELGGDSLLSTVLIGKVHAAFGVELSVLDIYMVSTLEEMARHIDRIPAGGRKERLTLLQPEGEDVPWFCIPGAEGSLLTFAEMAHCLKPRTPLYGFTPVGADGGEAPLTRIEDMAARYIEELRRVRPEGPYRLIGFCMGGFIAYEMAVQLTRGGVAMDSVTLIDSHLLPRDVYADEVRSLCIYAGLSGVPMRLVEGVDTDPRLRLLNAMTRDTGAARPLGVTLAELERLPPERRLSVLYHCARREGFLEGMTEKAFRDGYAVLRANMDAMHAYTPSPWKGRIDFFRATANPEGGPDALAWWAGAAHMRVFDIPGNHLTVMGGDAVRDIVRLIRENARNQDA